jgi:HSP20 family protein
LQEATVAEEPLASDTWAPPVDLCETKESIVLRVELPGIAAEQIKIGATNTQIKIRGEKKRNKPRNRILSHLCSERSYGRFCRLVPLRWTVSLEDASAELENGILLVTFPKIEDRRGAEFVIEVTDKNTK